ncbi:MAG: hypothetical protein JO205_04580 [Pseudolabrys sp.]|nr:hypothetical protein [Pseudolabrys sp.]MBV9260627.1 hypothetical protein [Pseudolabrys sp.]
MIRIALLVLALSAAPALADECGDAVRDYNAIISKMTDAMDQFRTCFADSKGMDDCAVSFNKLRLAYGQFTSIVSFYSKQCETKR